MTRYLGRFGTNALHGDYLRLLYMTILAPYGFTTDGGSGTDNDTTESDEGATEEQTDAT